ncbi:hypothetical protein [Polyangium mundeleinium]|uniref:Cell surface protein n=1 Tax=Polyangium mundeleinium TaxID=2995306 RepID=A0ABT5EMK9_9BACT|nr:hypothetical protein [Polyangium mundeleinium]MDC0743063.1 hypothetical protein [Polyangium mundeleinium]
MVNRVPGVLRLFFLAMLASAMPGCGSHVELADVCEPHAQELCYTGPEGTEGVGACRAGLRTCAGDGSGFGPCTGEILPAFEACSIPGDENCDGTSAVCTGETSWAKRFASPEDEFVRSAAATDAGGIVLGIDLVGALDVGGPVGVVESALGQGACVLELGAEGDPLGAEVLHGGDGWDFFVTHGAGRTSGVGRFSGPVTLAGETFTSVSDQDALLFSLDPAGDIVFRKQISASTASLFIDAIGSNAAGDLLLGGGTSANSLDLGGGPLVDADGVTFLGRFDAAGNHIFSKTLPPVEVNSTRFDPQGNIFLSGYMYDSANFGGETLTSVGQKDYFVVKLGPSGEHLWSKRFGGSGIISSSYSSYLTIEPDAAGNVYLAGVFSETWDFGGGPVTSKASEGAGDAFLVKLDPNGKYLWGKFFGNGQYQSANAITTDPSGSVILGGSFGGTVDFGAGVLQASSPLSLDIFVAKFSPDGEPLWSRRFGGGNALFLSPNGLVVAPSGHVYMAGTVYGDLDFGSGDLKATHAGADVFVVKLDP